MSLIRFDLDALHRHGKVLGAVGEKLARAGFGERTACAWFGVPLVSDVRWLVTAGRLPAERSRRGLGGWIAALVGGETVDARALGILDESDLDALAAIGWIARDGDALGARISIVPVRGSIVAADRLDARDPGATWSPDLSAWNVAASLPRSGTLLDVGTGAGAVAVVAARSGARVTGTDVDERALAFARANAQLNRVAIDLRAGDLFADTRERFDAVAFNAPLVRAEAATTDAPLYLRAPDAEGLVVRFLDGAKERVHDGGEALCHAQLSPAVSGAAARHPRRLEIAFADAPDGTPHALTILDGAGAPAASRVRVPLGAACPHLTREIVDRLAATRDALAAGAPLDGARPAPWLALTRTTVHDGAAFRPRAVRFGDHTLDEEELALLERGDGSDALRRALAERGLLVV